MKLCLTAVLIATAAAAPAIVVQNTQYDPTNPNIQNGGKWINDMSTPQSDTGVVQNAISCSNEENGHVTKITHGRCSLEIRATSQDEDDSNSHNEIHDINDPNTDGYFEISYEDWTSKSANNRDCDLDIKVKVDWTNTQLTNNQINVQVDMAKTGASAGHQLMAGYEYRQFHDGQQIGSGWNHVYHNGGDTTHTETFQWHARDHPCQGCGVTCEISETTGLIEVTHNTDSAFHDSSMDQHRCYINDNDACQCLCSKTHYEEVYSHDYYANDFQNGQDSWTCGGTDDCGTWGMVCGGHNNKGNNDEISRTFTGYEAGTYKISMTYFHIDTWDNERGEIYYDTTKIWSSDQVAHGDLENSANGMHGVTGGVDQCKNHGSPGWRWATDVKTDAGDVTFQHAGGDFTIKVKSTLNQGPSDESFGIGNIIIEKLKNAIPTGCVDHLCTQCETGYTHDAAENYLDGGHLVCHLITESPTNSPTPQPTKSPTKSPTKNPTMSPTKACLTTCQLDATTSLITVEHDASSGHNRHRCYIDDFSSNNCACECTGHPQGE